MREMGGTLGYSHEEWLQGRLVSGWRGRGGREEGRESWEEVMEEGRRT